MIGKFKIVVDIAFLLTNIGIILSCMLTFNDFMSGLFHQKFIGHQNGLMSSKNSLFWIILPGLLLLPILVRKNYKDITAFSCIAVFAIVLLAFFCIYLFSHRAMDIEYNKLELFEPKGGVNCFILLLFGYLNQQSLIDVFGELKR